MKVTRIYTGDDNRSHFEERDIPLQRAADGSESVVLSSPGVVFRENRVGDALDSHTAPRRQFVVTIFGVEEIECGDGTLRRFKAGVIMLADDTTGQGHITREIEGPRRAIFIRVPENLDVNPWRIRSS